LNFFSNYFIAGHGFAGGPTSAAITLETDTGELAPIDVQRMREVLKSAETGLRTRLVFVAACESDQTGRVFEKAGVEHVVAMRHKVVDAHARCFTKEFYKYLLRPLSVRAAFDMAFQSVSLQFPSAENAFILLPTDTSHDEVLFEAVAPGDLKYSTSRCVAKIDTLPPCHIEQQLHMQSIYKLFRDVDNPNHIVTGTLLLLSFLG